ncbi:sigma-70 family RNA polymerase sigma factor [Tuwongella immobilis]|uniref:sigma-70 family RNA polymerase sigma factor n=1 Tax=Tuwongella immobilis TaxID=692036 RepID=UPI001E57B652|nr:sigma-70 family RNA polymerase sigma factor [Tuwongella immobilis]
MTDAHAQPEHYADYLRMLARSQITSRLQAKLDASDIVQQTLLQAHRNQHQYRGQTEAEWVGWLRVILANVLATELRKFHTQARDPAREMSIEASLDHSASRFDNLLAADQTSPSERAGRSEQRLQLARALAQLPNDQREVIERHHLMGWTIAEVAEQMQKSKPAVVGLLFRGLKRLRECLSDQEGSTHATKSSG